MIIPPLVDCDTWIGSRDLDVGTTPATATPERLLEEMDRVGVQHALVYHRDARTGNDPAGNDKLLDALDGYSRLWPSLVASPAIYESYGNEAFRAAVRETGTRAVRLFPSEHGYRLDEPGCHPLLDALSELGAVAFVRGQAVRQEGFGYDELVDVCTSYEDPASAWGGLDVVLTELPKIQGQYEQGLEDLEGALGRTENLSVETRKLQFPDVLERLADRFGVDRLVFGSQYPEASLGAAVANVALSSLSGRERRQVGARNLIELLHRPPTEPQPDESLPVRGFPWFDDGLIDMHGHVRLDPDEVGYPDPATLVEQLDRTGIALCCVSEIYHDATGNDYAAACAERFPNRLVPFASANPKMDDVYAELERCFDELGMRMIKIHPASHEVEAWDERYDPVWKFADERECLVVTHARMFDEERDAFIEAASEHPGMTLMLYHAGRGWGRVDNFVQAAEECPNVLLEITMSTVPDGIIEYLVGEVGPERVFFGTDLGYRTPESQVGWACFARLDDGEQRLVLRENGLKLLEEMGALPAAYRD